MQRQLANDPGGHSPDKIMLVPGEPDAVVVAPAVDIERMVAPKAQGFGERHFKYRGDFVLAGVIVQIRGIMPTTGVT